MLLSSVISQKQIAILDGLLKMKESMIPTLAVNSQMNKKLRRIRTLEIRTIRLCFRWFFRYCSWLFDSSLINVQLLPYQVKICFKFRCIAPVQRSVLLKVKNEGDRLFHDGRTFG